MELKSIQHLVNELFYSRFFITAFFLLGGSLKEYIIKWKYSAIYWLWSIIGFG